MSRHTAETSSQSNAYSNELQLVVVKQPNKRLIADKKNL